MPGKSCFRVVLKILIELGVIIRDKTDVVSEKGEFLL
jgi:hypothetical protein